MVICGCRMEAKCRALPPRIQKGQAWSVYKPAMRVSNEGASHCVHFEEESLRHTQSDQSHLPIARAPCATLEQGCRQIKLLPLDIRTHRSTHHHRY
ncbi:hypothetical protein HBH56_210640 [Parastagonospora nodorum]|nr:hypothetical protein HBH56_210640 [Parastagonospora nodorum]KAH3931647.1 hypothetical protein HBH54_099250 [Parastagonospora nodorum]KAH3944291.1 hypothetical protein HBH53_160710 [Parastagonospora nodorum]KAH3960698.1 hypothetical protein HBH51_189000 [Parastagonospora nodorum]KAH3962889.1 hypothetical protein HBH52_221670 [Parastagonospora nodorum]